MAVCRIDFQSNTVKLRERPRPSALSYDRAMKSSAISPHIFWCGSQPQRKLDAYLLAILVRIEVDELESHRCKKRDALLQPSILTADNLGPVARLYAYCQALMEKRHVDSAGAMAHLIRDSECGGVASGLPESRQAVGRAKAELLEFVERNASPGFKSYG